MMKRINFLWPILVLTLLFSCDDQAIDNSPNSIDSTLIKAQVNTPTLTTKQPAPNTSVDAIERKGQTVSVASFNQKITKAKESGDAWAESPILVAVKFGGESMDSYKKTIDLEAPNGEARDQLLVTITEDGFLDDSIKGSMLILRLQKKEGLWQIQKATRAWNCYRGHKEFNAKPCS